MIPRQLAPTVGQMAAAGPVFCTGPPSSDSGERVATGLVVAFGAIDYVFDNTGSLAGSALPQNGSIIHFGEHRVFVVVVPEFPAVVQPCSDHLRKEMAGEADNDAPHVYAECMVTRRFDELPKATHTAEARSTVEVVLENLAAPIVLGADPEETAAALERVR